MGNVLGMGDTRPVHQRPVHHVWCSGTVTWRDDQTLDLKDNGRTACGDPVRPGQQVQPEEDFSYEPNVAINWCPGCLVAMVERRLGESDEGMDDNEDNR